MKYLLLLSLLSVAAYLAFNWVSDWVDTKKVHDLLPKSSGRILLGLSTALAIVLMLCFAFMQDDAYISARKWTFLEHWRQATSPGVHQLSMGPYHVGASCAWAQH